MLGTQGPEIPRFLAARASRPDVIGVTLRPLAPAELHADHAQVGAHKRHALGIPLGTLAATHRLATAQLWQRRPVEISANERLPTLHALGLPLATLPGLRCWTCDH